MPTTLTILGAGATLFVLLVGRGVLNRRAPADPETVSAQWLREHYYHDGQRGA